MAVQTSACPEQKSKALPSWAANRNQPQHRLKFVVTITQWIAPKKKNQTNKQKKNLVIIIIIIIIIIIKQELPLSIFIELLSRFCCCFVLKLVIYTLTISLLFLCYS